MESLIERERKCVACKESKPTTEFESLRVVCKDCSRKKFSKKHEYICNICGSKLKATGCSLVDTKCPFCQTGELKEPKQVDLRFKKINR